MLEKIIADNLGVDQDSIKDSQKIMEDLGADSLNIVELVMKIEEEYDIDIPDEDVEVLITVGDVKQYLENNA